MAFDINSAKPASVGKFDISSAKSVGDEKSDPRSRMNPSSMWAGPAWNSPMEAIKQGAGWEDVPGVIEGGVTGLTGDIPRNIARDPMSFAMGGVMGATNADRSKELPSWYPQAKTEPGRQLAEQAELAGATALAIPMFTEVLPMAVKNFPGMARRARSLVTGKSAKLARGAETLQGQVVDARKLVGKHIEDYVAQTGHEPVNAQQLDELMSTMPENLRKAIMDDPNILKNLVGQKDVGGFVMGPASKQVTPQKTTFSVKKMTRGQKEASGGVGGKPRMMTERTGIEDPGTGVRTTLRGDISPQEELTGVMAMRQSGKKGVAVSPKTSYTVTPELRGASKLAGGEQKVQPTLKNVERVRDVIKKESPTEFDYNPFEMKARNDSFQAKRGARKLMKQDRPVLADLYKKYAKMKGGEKKLGRRLIDPVTGIGKDRSALAIGNKKIGASDMRGFLDYASKFVPEIKDTVRSIEKIRSAVDREKAFAKFGERLAYMIGGGAVIGRQFTSDY